MTMFYLRRILGWKNLVQQPDENFARELLQLFSIGLLKLNEDGTPVLDPNTKQPLRTYDSKDIMSMARFWTGFTSRNKRGNVESISSDYWNFIDPMKIIPKYRDRFPKTDLLGGYIGDGYPLCVDFPSKAFLKVGAKYRLLGSNPKPEMIEEDPEWASSLPDTKRLQLNKGASSSGLYDLLCAESADGSCTFPGLVTLESNLSCPPGATAVECKVDAVNIVQVEGIFYEHIRQPCVEMAFYNDGRTVTYKHRWQSPSCANPKLAVAGAACCDKEWTGWGRFNAQPSCEYAGERVTLKTAEDRCEAHGMEVCNFYNITTDENCPHNPHIFNWREESCWVKAKINGEGEVAMYHEAQIERSYEPERMLRNKTMTFFSVAWDSESFPTVGNNCGNGLCQQDEGMCFCETTVQDTIVFSSAPAGATDILEKLKIGHPALAMLNADAYQRVQQGDYSYHSSDGACCDLETVFEVEDRNGVTQYLRNVHSSVNIVGSDFSFRNPPHFNSVLEPEFSIADAEHETDALLQHLFYHPNTAPFLAKNFILRFGVSNPSPRYVREVAKGKKVQELKFSFLLFLWETMLLTPFVFLVAWYSFQKWSLRVSQ